MALKMSKPFDYSKWDRLEISDDEETFHPNLDKGLNVRVNRITRGRKEDEIDEEIKKAEAAGDTTKAEKAESKRPLHVGNLCHVAEERTIINSSEGRSDRLVKDGESFELDEYTQFKADHKSLLDAFTEADWERSHELLMSRGDILMDDYTNSYFLLGALDAEMKGDKALVKKLARQGQIISQIHQLAKPMNRPPRDLVPRFFEKFTAGHAQAAFEEGVTHFMQQIAKRAIDKKAEEAAAAEEAEEAGEQEGEAVSLVEAMYQMTPEERMGPGGLDPVEVFESLPEELQECFRSSDVERLKQVSKTMVDFDKHFKRCVDAGLWQSGK